MINLKPIETQYNGFRFRSRLEARWAVFFDALGIKYLYEPEGFDLGDELWYLPDFYLPEVDGGLWVEVKGVMDKLSEKKIEKFRDLLTPDRGDCCLFVVGNIPPKFINKEDHLYWLMDSQIGSYGSGGDWPMGLARCPVCGKWGIVYEGQYRSARLCGGEKQRHVCTNGTYGDYGTDQEIEQQMSHAYDLARQARFESW